jgi:hypothetical protein
MVMTSRERHGLGSAWTTYYEHRVFMVYLPNDFRDYLGRVVTGERDWMRNPRALDWMAWGTVLTFQARMEPFRFNEALNRYYEGDGKFRDGYDEEGAPLWQPMFRLQLTMQLAQEVVANHANIEARIDEYPTQAQLLFDTLHYVTELHGAEKPVGYVFTISKNSLGTYLRQRAENDRGFGLGLDFPGPDRLTPLWDHLRFYLDLLAEPECLRERALTDSRLLRRSPQEMQLRTRLVRAILLHPVIGDLVPDRPPAEGSPPAEEIEFRFLINRFGVGQTDEADPLREAEKAEAALASWDRLLTALFGDPIKGQSMAVAAGILDKTPSREAIKRARALLSDRAETDASEPVRRPDAEERQRRFAARQLRAALEMLDGWRGVFREGVRMVNVAALVPLVPPEDPQTRRQSALELLRTFCRLDLKEQPKEVIAFLQEVLKSLRLEPIKEDNTPANSFVENPKALESYCNDLTPPPDAADEQQAAAVDQPAPTPGSPLLIRDKRVATEVEWPTLWRNFWLLWEFQPTVVTLHRQSNGSAATRSESSDTPTAARSAQSGASEAGGSIPPDAPAVADAAATGLAVLHAARHGGIPVIPGLRANLSIGQWWRLVTLAVFSDESKSIPAEAVSAALQALGFRDDSKNLLENSLSDFPARPAADNAPVLFVSIRATASPAWLWPPDSRVAAVIMPPPSDVVKADRAAIPDSQRVQNEFNNVWDRAKQRAQSRTLLEPLRRLWRRLRRLPPVRSLDLIKCQEIGPEFDPSEHAAGVYLFGFEPARPGVSDYIASPTGIGDLLERIRYMDGRRQTR